MTKPVIDPWLVNADGTVDPFASTVDFGMTSHDEIDDPDIHVDIQPGLTPDVVISEGGVIRQPEAPADPVVVSQEPQGPEVIDLEDGGSIILDKEKGQWKATLDPGNGANPEVFWGKNKDGLVVNVLKAKLNATKKIRELNKQVKLGNAPARTVQPVAVPTLGRVLTGDEIFEIQTQLGSNPDLALETWFQKRTGKSVDELVALAQKGANADANLRTESVCRNFLNRNPDWYNDPESQNFISLVQWLSKYKLSKIIPDGADVTPGMFELDATGNWTVETLEEAFADLSGDGDLVRAPKPQQAPPSAETTQQVPVSAPAPVQRPDERIVRTETRPRAALGIRPSDLTSVAAPEAPTAPSAEDFENMSDKEIAATLAAYRRSRVAQVRRS
jgi:hypothetical protein